MHSLKILKNCPAGNWFLLSLAFLLGTPVAAKPTGFFAAEEPVTFRLEGPISTLETQRGEDPEWLEGKIYLKSCDGAEIVLDVEFQARGNFRRQESSCSFPSFWINFKKKQVDGTIFDGLDKVKVVSHCRENRKSFEPYIFKEYLAYKTYNLLTEESFRVRLVEIDYVNTERKNKSKTHAAFFIEHVDDFAKRLDARQVEDRYILPSLYNEEKLCLAEMFQFFVGNTDFSFFASVEECCHNGKAFATADGYLAVPYDFDLTGLVDVPYAAVNPRLPIKSVTDRYYRGTRTPDEVLQATIKLFADKKWDIISLWDNAAILPDKVKATALAYIQEFYEIIEDPDRVQTEIVDRFLSKEKTEATILERIGKSGL